VPSPGTTYRPVTVPAWCATIWHLVGTCRMGRSADAVVSPRLTVHGLENLFVADASVMPATTRGNTHAPTILIAEKAADRIAAAG
jgi:choline dehydrogenase